ncbi:MAG: ABC transporter ATP-binding protein [Butyrivibrio sp.]|nr:ABC transporter ATP-binding protein [Butyrivibrio sp.]
MIELRGIKKTYNSEGVRVEALRGINLKIETGEYLTVMGQSGSGKSTLLHILGTMDGASEGQYFYNDTEVSALNKKEADAFRKNHIGFVFQNYALMKFYTVYENIEVPLLAKGMGKKERKRIIERNMEQVGIADLRKKLPIHISGGQMQRCAIARALAADNDILLADEPTGALDRRTGEEIMDVFDKIRSGERTIILVSHDEKVAARTERIVRIEDGRII